MPNSAAAFSLDDIERPDKAEPFTVTIGGNVYTMVDPLELDYRDLLGGFQAAQQGDPEILVRMVVREDDREGFFANPLPMYKLEALFKAYNEHFGLNPGEAGASPVS